MLYDRYGQFRLETESAGHAHLQRGETSHVPSARAGAQDVPNTSYKPDDGRGRAPQLVMTPDALAYSKNLDDKRKGNAAEAHAEVAECEFELGHSLRLTWIPSQRADKALMPMFSAKDLANG